MPKFLDAPSWYGEEGDLLFAGGYKEIDCSASGGTNIYLMDLAEGEYRLVNNSLSTTKKTVTFWLGTSDHPGSTSIKNSSVDFSSKRILDFFTFKLTKKPAATSGGYINRSAIFNGFRLLGASNTGSILASGNYSWIVSAFGYEEKCNFSLSYGVNDYSSSALCYSKSITSINGYYHGDEVTNMSIYVADNAGIAGQLLMSNGSSNAPTWQGGPVAHYIRVALPVPNSGNLYFTFFDHDATAITTSNANNRFDFATARILPASGTIRIGSDYAIITHIQLFAGSFNVYGVSFSGGSITSDNYSKSYGVNEISTISDSVLSIY